MSAVSPSVRYFNGPDGFAHATATVKRIAELGLAGAHTIEVRQAATRITRDVPSKQCKAELAALYRWVRDNVRYRKDPVGCEWVQSPAVTLRELAGDCDDMSALLAALAQSIGYQVRFRTVGPTSAAQKHVSCEALCEGEWISLDPVLEPPATSTGSRAELGMFGRRGPGAAHYYSSGGAMLSGNDSFRGHALWPSTPLERQPGLTPVASSLARLWGPTPLERQPALANVGPAFYRRAGAFGPASPTAPMLNTWNNALDPTDLSGLGAGPKSGLDVSGASEYLWAASYAAHEKKKVNDKVAREAWWKRIGVDGRQGARVTYLAMSRHAPKGLTPAQANAWWQKLGKKKREQYREKYRGGSFIDTAIDVVTLQPIVAPIVKHIPVLKDIHNTVHSATVSLHRAPLDAFISVAKGERIDKAALNSFKQQLAAAKQLAPVAQAVISFVPGIGTGLSAGIGAGLALAEGKSIDKALVSAVRGALPGGALAQAAFDVAAAAASGKPIEQIAINALPVGDAAKAALVKGAQLARAVAEGKRVDQAALDVAVKALPPALQRAAQVGVAVATAAKAQGKTIPTPSSASSSKPAPKPASKPSVKRPVPVSAVKVALKKLPTLAKKKPGVKPTAKVQRVKAKTPAKPKTAGDAQFNAVKSELQSLFAEQRQANAAQASQLQAMVLELQRAGAALYAQARSGGWPDGSKQVWDNERQRWMVYAPKGLAGVSLNWSLSGAETDKAALAVAAVNAFIKKNGKPPAIAIKAVREFQAVTEGLVVDGLWGNNSRKAASYHLGKPIEQMPAVAKAWASKPATWQPPAAAPAPTPTITVGPAVVTKPKPPVATKPAPAPAPAKPAPAPAAPSRRELARAAVDSVNAFIKKNGKPPAIPVKAVRTYQAAVGKALKLDGLWGPVTRSQAAADLGVAESSLPRSAYDAKAKAKKPAPAKPKPKPPVATKPAPAPAPAKPAPAPAAPSRRELARAAVDSVNAFIKKNGKPPAIPVKAVRTYQAAVGKALKLDGLWGPVTRSQAAADLGVAESSLPRSAYDAKAKAKKPAPKPPTSSAPAKPKPAEPPQASSPAPSSPVPMEQVWSGSEDPNLPVLGPGPSQTPGPAKGQREDGAKTAALVLVGYYFLKRNKRAA